MERQQCLVIKMMMLVLLLLMVVLLELLHFCQASLLLTVRATLLLVVLAQQQKLLLYLSAHVLLSAHMPQVAQSLSLGAHPVGSALAPTSWQQQPPVQPAPLTLGC